jgi:hypothetical protein
MIDIKQLASTMTKEQFLYEVLENYEGKYSECCPSSFGLQSIYTKKNGTCSNTGGEEQCINCIKTSIENISFMSTKNEKSKKKKRYEILGHFFDGEYSFFKNYNGAEEFYEAILMQSMNPNKDEIQWNIDEYEWNCSVEDLQCKKEKITMDEQKFDEFIKNMYIESCDNLENKKDAYSEYVAFDSDLQYKKAPKDKLQSKSIGYSIVNDGINQNSIRKYKCSKFLKDKGVIDKNCMYFYEMQIGDGCLIFLEIED